MLSMLANLLILSTATAAAPPTASEITRDICFDFFNEGVSVNHDIAQKLKETRAKLSKLEGKPVPPDAPLYLFDHEKIDQGVRKILKSDESPRAKYVLIEQVLRANNSTFPGDCDAAARPIGEACKGEASTPQALAACVNREIGPPAKNPKMVNLMKIVANYAEFEKRLNAK